MRNLFLTFLFVSLILGAHWGHAQDDLSVIRIIESSGAYKQISENNFKLTFQWEPVPGAERYTIRFGYEVGDAEDPGSGLLESKPVSGDSTVQTISVKSNNCFVQVIAFDEANQILAKSGVYSASLTFGAASVSTGLEFVFLEAFGKSFIDMDPIAGWAIVLAILFLLLYGIYMHAFINKQIRLQDYRLNSTLKEKVDQVVQKWSSLNETKLKQEKARRLTEERWASRTEKEDDALKNKVLAGFTHEEGEKLAKEELERLKREKLETQIKEELEELGYEQIELIAKEELEKLRSDCEAYQDGKYSILRIFEMGLENHIANYGRDIVSEEVDRDMEKGILCEIENLKLGNTGGKDKHVSLNRIKMFGETAPMLGLLGTVSGLIVAFFKILQESSGETGGGYQSLLSELSSGIYSAIVTTIVGLIVGIILLYMHHAVEGGIRRVQNSWQNLYREVSRHIS